MTKKVKGTTKAKAPKDGLKMLAVRGPLALHRAATAAAKQSGISLGAAILRGLEMFIAHPPKEVAKAKAPKVTRKAAPKKVAVPPAAQAHPATVSVPAR